MAQALVEAKTGIDHETRKDKVKREEKKQTKKRNNKRMSRCEDSPEQKRMYKDVRDKEHKELQRDVTDMWKKTVLIRWDDLRDAFFK